VIVGERPEWHAEAACRGTDPEVFFPRTSDPRHEALALCASCPVRSQCLEHALALPEDHGTWGGRSERARRRIRRRRILMPPTGEPA
jgi:WhiB family redox-sensing transcriptional regulator